MHAIVLRYFSEVARCGSIRKASDALNVASSAVNRQILKLEDALGMPLFERLPGGVRLTPAGEILMRHIRETLFEYERVRSELDDLRGLKTGHVRIAAVDSLMVDFLPSAVAAFHGSYPGVTYAVIATGPVDVTTEVAEGRADIGLTFTRSLQPSVTTLAEIETPMGAVMTPSHPLASRKRLRLQDCARYPVFLQPDTAPLTPLLEAEFAAAGTEISPKLVSNSIDLMKHVVRANMGVAFFSMLGFREEVANGELVHIPLAEPRLAELRLGVIVPAQRRLNVVAAVMANVLGQRLQALVL